MTWLELVAEEVPELPEELRGMVLWEYTGFPSFWQGKPEECCRAQLRAFRERWLREGEFWDPIEEALCGLLAAATTATDSPDAAR